jgi:hypothetical protein
MDFFPDFACILAGACQHVRAKSWIEKGHPGCSQSQLGKDGLTVKKFFAFLLTFGMICAMGVTTVGCSKKEEKKDAAKKDDAKKDDAKKAGT